VLLHGNLPIRRSISSGCPVERHMEMPKEPPHAKAVRPSSIAIYKMNYMLYGQ
jgi:hypothetical protein